MGGNGEWNVFFGEGGRGQPLLLYYTLTLIRVRYNSSCRCSFTIQYPLSNFRH